MEKVEAFDLPRCFFLNAPGNVCRKELESLRERDFYSFFGRASQLQRRRQLVVVGFTARASSYIIDGYSDTR